MDTRPPSLPAARWQKFQTSSELLASIYYDYILVSRSCFPTIGTAPLGLGRRGRRIGGSIICNRSIAAPRCRLTDFSRRFGGRAAARLSKQRTRIYPPPRAVARRDYRLERVVKKCVRPPANDGLAPRSDSQFHARRGEADAGGADVRCPPD